MTIQPPFRTNYRQLRNFDPPFTRRPATILTRPRLMAASVVFLSTCLFITASALPTEPHYTFPIDRAGDYSYSWSAADGIDLFSTESTLTQAAEEAQRLSLSVGTEASFPGYGPSWSAQMNSTSKIWINSDGAHKSHSSEKRDYFLEYGDIPAPFAPEYKTFGTIRAHIAEVSPRTNGFATVYCVDLRDAVHLTPARRYQWDSTLSTQSITFTQDGDSTNPSRPQPVGGPNRAPSHNAFSGWAIEEMVPSENPEHKSACRDWQLGQHADVQIEDTEDMIPTPPGHLRRAPSAGENYPGWPSEPLQ